MAKKTAETDAAGATAEKPAKKPDTRLSGFYARNPALVCLIGLDTSHTARIASEDHPDAHPLFDRRVFDEVTEADVDAAMGVGEDVDIVPVERVMLPGRVLQLSFAKALKAAGADITIQGGAVVSPDLIEVEAAIDGRHRVNSYREANARRVRASLEPFNVKVELKRGLTDLRAMELRVSRNALRREDSVITKARLAEDMITLKAQERREAGDEDLSRKAWMREVAPFFGVTDVAIRQWVTILKRHPDVIAAVDDERISPSCAYKDFKKIPYDEQPEFLRRMLNPDAQAQGADGEGDTDGEGDADGEADDMGGAPGTEPDGDGAGAGESARLASAGEWKPDKKALNKVLSLVESKQAELPDAFVLGMRFAMGHAVAENRVKGLTALLRDHGIRAS